MILDLFTKKKHSVLGSIVGLMMVSVFTFTGCSLSKEQVPMLGSVSTETVPEVPTMQEEPTLNYEMPKMEPGIVVDRNGYSSAEQKYAWVVSDEIPGEYAIIDSDSMEVVLEGTPSYSNYDEENECYISELRFAQLQDEGTYYIELDKLGMSCSFVVRDTYYGNIFEEILAEEIDRCKSGEASSWEVYSMIYTYERYKDAISEESEKQLSIMEAVKEWIAGANFDDTDEVAAYINTSLLAKFAYNYNDVDYNLASECLKKAAAIFGTVSETSEHIPERFMALTELYRSSGDTGYSSAILGISPVIKEMVRPHNNRFILYGSMSYMTTRKYVDRTLCDKLMNEMLHECEDNNKDKRMLHPINGNVEIASELLVYAQQFEVLNYILDGYEYNEKIMSIMHYLAGRNYQGYVCDLTDGYQSDAIIIYAWLALLEKKGKLDPSAPVVWQYSW